MQSEITKFRSQTQSVLDDFRKEGNGLIHETQEFLAQLKHYSKENRLNKSKSVQQFNLEEISQKENIPPPSLLKSMSSLSETDNDFSWKKEMSLVWDAINTIIGNTHDHLEKIKVEIKTLRNHNHQNNIHHQVEAKKSFLEKEMPHIITRVKDQVHNQLIEVQKEFEDKIIALEDNFVNSWHNLRQNLNEHKNETEHFLKDKTDEIRKTLLDETNNFEETIQSLQSPFLRVFICWKKCLGFIKNRCEKTILRKTNQNTPTQKDQFNMI